MPSSRPAPPAAPLGDEDFDTRVAGIAALGEPVRRALYRYVVAQPEPVNREQAAEGTGVAHHVAKFHLDKLADDGLLDVDFRRPAGRTGPGAGRPAKFYRRAARELTVSLPERHYDLAGRLLAAAVTDADHDGVAVSEALSHAAIETGRSAGREARLRAGSRPSRTALLDTTTDVLRSCGYEPRVGPDGVTLANCPFHALARDYTDLVCGMNLDLITGIVHGLGASELEPHLAPTEGQCCVRINRRVMSPSRR